MAAALDPEGRHRRLILIGHGGRTLWERVKAALATEHPIDEFTRARVAEWLAAQLPGVAHELVYPGDTPVGLQALGRLAGWHHESPFRVGVNADWGRGSPIVPCCWSMPTCRRAFRRPAPRQHATCPSQPCVTACPASALSDRDFAAEVRCLSAAAGFALPRHLRLAYQLPAPGASLRRRADRAQLFALAGDDREVLLSRRRERAAPRRRQPDEAEQRPRQQQPRNRKPQSSTRRVASAIEPMVIAKPSEFWIASALPTICGGQALADIAENCGESATTDIPTAASAPAARAADSGKREDEAAGGRNGERDGGDAGAADACREVAAEHAAERADADDGEGQRRDGDAERPAGRSSPPASASASTSRRAPLVAEVAERRGTVFGDLEGAEDAAERDRRCAVAALQVRAVAEAQDHQGRDDGQR